MTRRLHRALACFVATAAAWAGPVAAYEDDVVRPYASIAWIHDDNLFRLPDGAIAPGASGRSAQFLSLGAGVDLEREWSQQLFNVSLGVGGSRFGEYAGLDSTTWQFAGSVKWRLGDQHNVVLSAGADRSTVGFADLRAAQLAQVRGDRLALGGQFEFVPRWSLLASTGVAEARNDVESRRALDNQSRYVDLGVRHDWRTGSTFDAFVRESRFGYPNLQVLDAVGNPLPVLVDNDYRQRDLGVRLNWQVTEVTQLSGSAGLASRRHANLPGRDFDGPNVRLTAAWQPTGKLNVSATLLDEPSSVADVAANYVMSTGLRLQAAWLPTAKVTVNGSAESIRRTFKGDPGLLLIGATRRADAFRAFGMGVSAQPWHLLTLGLDLRREQRDSNYDAFDYSSTTVTLRASLRF